MRPGDAPAGFTLIEVLVGLTIGAVLVLLAHGAFGAAVDVTERLDAQRAAHARAMRAEARLDQAFGSLAIGVAGAGGFYGLPDRVTFSATLSDGGPGTISMDSLTLRVEGGWLVLRRAGAAPDSLLPAASTTFDYLLEYGSQARWVREWHSPASAPLAVRLRLARDGAATDTLLFLIGPRG